MYKKYVQKKVGGFVMLELQQERDRLMIEALFGKKADFSNLRCICKRYNNENGKTFELNNSDEQLWEDVNAFFKELLAKS